MLAPVTSSTPQRTNSFHERIDKEPVVLLVIVWFFQKNESYDNSIKPGS
jgi:hypothetical protein